MALNITLPILLVTALAEMPQAWAKEAQPSPAPTEFQVEDLRKYCYSELNKLPGIKNLRQLDLACKEVKILSGCYSGVDHKPIFSYDRKSRLGEKGKKILTLALIHGDEVPSGSVARSWMIRLSKLNPRNNWRVIPIANPDGLKARTRTNGKGVDVNRNFPTSQWTKLAIKKWEDVKKKDPRRYPGPSPASEVETRCLIDHFKDFQPDFIISIHTPLGVLDFDGPKKLDFPKFSPLPWISLGHMPGSLGRYMWQDHNIPVLTIELKGSSGIQQLEQFDRLQDISGTVAIQADRNRKRRPPKKEPDKKKEPSQTKIELKSNDDA